MPRRICAFIFLVVFAIDVVFSIIGTLTGAPDVWTVSFPSFVVIGLLCALIFWGVNFFRELRVRPDGLQFGRRFVPFSAIESARHVDHVEAKRVQSTMRYSMLVPSTWGQKKRLNGVWWQRWMDGAIFVHLKPGSRVITDDWLIGTRHPQELMELIQAGISQAPKAAPTTEATSSLPGATTSSPGS